MDRITTPMTCFSIAASRGKNDRTENLPLCHVHEYQISTKREMLYCSVCLLWNSAQRIKNAIVASVQHEHGTLSHEQRRGFRRFEACRIRMHGETRQAFMIICPSSNMQLFRFCCRPVPLICHVSNGLQRDSLRWWSDWCETYLILAERCNFIAMSGYRHDMLSVVGNASVLWQDDWSQDYLLIYWSTTEGPCGHLHRR